MLLYVESLSTNISLIIFGHQNHIIFFLTLDKNLMSDFSVEIRLDRVGAVFKVGETVTGVLVVTCSSNTSHNGIHLLVEGAITIQPSSRSQGIFEALYEKLEPVEMLHLPITLATKGALPAGETEIPFSFALLPNNPEIPLVETYHGVYICSGYCVGGFVEFTFSKKQAKPVRLLVYSPGQSCPKAEDIAKDKGLDFTLNTASVRQGKKYNGPVIPQFSVIGHLDRYYNNIDAPLSGWICIQECDVNILSIEIQLIRSEYCATNENSGKESTEVQNIQVGDGDVLRNFTLPLHMMFPKWYTCAAIDTTHLRVEFEINMVVTVEGHNQITQNLPIRLYRGLDS